MEADATAMSASLQQLTCGDNGTFSLQLSGGSVFDCIEIVRRVPNKRLVCRGLWQGQPVYAKLFIGAQSARYARRDMAGVQMLVQAGIRTPSLLFHGPSQDSHAQVLLFAEIMGAVNAEHAMQLLGTDQAARLCLACQLVAEVAAHHRSGLIQGDLYLKNFLVRDSQVYTLDGDGIKPAPVILKQRQALLNLARLISKFDVVDVVAWLPQLLATYATGRGWQHTPSLEKMHHLVASHRLAVAKKYADEKVFRRCSDVHIEKVQGDFVAIARPFLSAGLLQALQNPDALLNADTARRIKSGNTCTVSLAQVDARKVVVKRYNIKSVWHALSRAFRQTRAAASWANAHRLTTLGITTAAPVALYEKRIGIIRRQSYFLTEYVDAPDVAQFFADTDLALAQKEAAAANIARLFYKLKLLMISHGDFKASNIKMVENWPVLIDLDSLRQHRCLWFFEQRHVRDLKRFIRNWPQDSVTQQLLLAAFSQVYEDTSLLEQAGIEIK